MRRHCVAYARGASPKAGGVSPEHSVSLHSNFLWTLEVEETEVAPIKVNYPSNHCTKRYTVLFG